MTTMILASKSNACCLKIEEFITFLSDQTEITHLLTDDAKDDD